MLVAKLKTPVKFQVELFPNKFEERIGDSIRVILEGYQLGLKKCTARIELQRETAVPLNPSSELEEEQFFTKNYEFLKLYILTLTEEDLSKWGYDDSELLNVVAEKIGLEVSEIINVESENIKVSEAYKEFCKQRDEGTEVMK